LKILGSKEVVYAIYGIGSHIPYLYGCSLPETIFLNAKAGAITGYLYLSIWLMRKIRGNIHDMVKKALESA
jgi:hypothetical protein